jgi:arylsulfatase A-like enzyme
MTRPNVLIILSDQLRRDALGVYGAPNVSTPAIDRLARNGVRFDAACSTYAVCVPFRFTLMTGEYAHTRKVPALHFRMDPNERTLADEFNENGYHTIYVGKWHLDGCGPKAAIPRERQGRWQKWYGFELRNAHFDTWYFEDGDPEPKRIDGYQTDGLFSIAMDYLVSSERPADKPFCCVLSVEPPHFPYEAPEEYMEKWRKRDIEVPPTFEVPAEYEMPLSHWPGDELDTAEIKRDHLRTYYAMIENLDDNVGRMMEFLEKRGMAENTVVMFVSDHGEQGGAHALPTAMKEYPFEASIGIPLIVTGPNAIRGREIAEPVCTEDLFPTLCGIAGIAPRNELPGENLAPLIAEETTELGREGILLEHVHEPRKPGAFYGMSFRGFRTQRYKYTVLAHGDEPARPWQFFDLERDPHEAVNMIDNPAHADEAQRLHEMMVQRMVETGDTFDAGTAPPRQQMG